VRDPERLVEVGAIDQLRRHVPGARDFTKRLQDASVAYPARLDDPNEVLLGRTYFWLA
jgi:hypothetical protein